MMTCKQVSQLVSESLDRQLSWRERIGMRIHLYMCNACSRFAEQMRFLRTVVRRFAELHAEGDPEVRLSKAARTRIKRRLDE